MPSSKYVSISYVFCKISIFKLTGRGKIEGEEETPPNTLNEIVIKTIS